MFYRRNHNCDSISKIVRVVLDCENILVDKRLIVNGITQVVIFTYRVFKIGGDKAQDGLPEQTILQIIPNECKRKPLGT